MLKLNSVKFSPEDIQAIKTFIEKREGIAVIAEPQMSGVWFHSENWELGVRLLLLADFHLTVSRVAFIHKRRGTMTSLLSLLEDFCIRNQVKQILIQSVETPEMAAWCMKNGFIPDPNASFWTNNILWKTIEKRL